MRAAILLAPVLFSCATPQRPLTPAQHSNYFTCAPERSINEAETGLVSAGYTVANRAEGYIQTTYKPTMLPMNYGLDRARTRVVVVNESPLRFDIYRDTGPGTLEGKWETLYDWHVAGKHSVLTAKALSAVRQAVCGDGALPNPSREAIDPG